VYDHCARPPQIHTSGQTMYHVFKHGVKPTWEDPANARGGAWIVRLRKGLAARFWEELLLAMVGEQFESGAEVRGRTANKKVRDARRGSSPLFLPLGSCF
jgi:translation initiation factor 4E